MYTTGRRLSGPRHERRDLARLCYSRFIIKSCPSCDTMIKSAPDNSKSNMVPIFDRCKSVKGQRLTSASSSLSSFPCLDIALLNKIIRIARFLEGLHHALVSLGFFHLINIEHSVPCRVWVTFVRLAKKLRDLALAKELMIDLINSARF